MATTEEMQRYGLTLTHVTLCRHMVKGCVDQWRSCPDGRDMGMLFDLIDRLTWTMRHGFDRPQYAPRFSRDEHVRASSALKFMLGEIDIADSRLPPQERDACESLMVRLDCVAEDMNTLMRLRTEQPEAAPR